MHIQSNFYKISSPRQTCELKFEDSKDFEDMKSIWDTFCQWKRGLTLINYVMRISIEIGDFEQGIVERRCWNDNDEVIVEQVKARALLLRVRACVFYTRQKRNEGALIRGTTLCQMSFHPQSGTLDRWLCLSSFHFSLFTRMSRDAIVSILRLVN